MEDTLKLQVTERKKLGTLPLLQGKALNMYVFHA